MSLQEKRQVDQVGTIELRGIEPIADAERHGTPFELFWIWFAANIGILGIIYGSILITSGLNMVQSSLVALIAPTVSFALVGALSVAGKWGGAPMLTLSRAPFGTRGNIGPTLISWISLVGWEIVVVTTAAYALLSLFALVGLPANTLWTVISLIVIALMVVAIGLLGHATLVWIQRAATWIFGTLTLVVAVFLIARTNWLVVLSTPPGPWNSGLLATLSIIMAGTGIGWVNTGADYARYLPRSSRGSSIILWTILGSTLPLFLLIMTGVLLSSSVKDLVSAANPVQAIGSALPSWMAVPYLLTAVGGLIAEADLSIYSSGLNLLALGLKVQRYKTILIDGVLMVAGSIYIMLIAQNFISPFESFLQLLADCLTAWSAVFLIDMLRRRRYETKGLIEMGSEGRYYYRGGVNRAGLISWLLGIIVSLLFTASPWFSGPLAVGVFASSSLGYLIGFGTSALAYWIFSTVGTRTSSKIQVAE